MVQETLKVQRISTYESLEDEHSEVMQVRVEETWLTPYNRYLADGLPPYELAEGKIVKRNSRRYTLIDGNLFRYDYTYLLLICVSGDQCTRIMSELHEGICGSHIGG